ncbi:MAG TPA: beta-ketoacyl-[acyl-carrier-protein] synthase family protein [Sphingobium sp.]|uniref:beta-ketoacyl-[acyl-carrier-protein] synthase family protein n=1 Tax=Sphingobium sp. TaxID=1912891 RepID=UPI002ED6694D
MTHVVVITGMGCISGLGSGLDISWQRALAGDGAIRPLDRGGVAGIAAWIAQEDLPDPAPWRRLGRLDPLSLYALAAATEAVDQAGLADHVVLADRTAILLGCGSGGNATIDEAFERLYARGSPKVHPQTIPSSMISAPTAHVAMALGVHGPAFVLSSACASSAHALGEAMHMIRAGRVDVAIAGGTEACLTLGSWTAWNALGVFASDSCRPFSQGRSGMVLGEGAAVLVLESEGHARERGATILGELAGYGASCDAAHITAPDCTGIVKAIRAAHGDAGIDPATPALISAHGTGTPLNDAVEAEALHAVYGEALSGHSVIATKSVHGHMIGATGAMEFVLGMMALREKTAPPTLHHLGPDPACDVPLVLERQSLAQKVLVSNSFAFGGLNAVLIGRAA